MNAFDTSLFLALTAGLDAPGWLIVVASTLASGVVPVVAIALALAWVRARPGCRGALLDAVAAGLLGLAVVQVFGWLLYRPRPFELGLGLNLMRHVPENSFPSDHATLMFALAVALSLSRLRPAGVVLLPLALLVGWARVYLGAHWPTDILTGAVLGAACAVLIGRLDGRAGLWAVVERFYEAALRKLHLPPAIFPRRT